MTKNAVKTILQMLLLMMAIGTLASAAGGLADIETPLTTLKGDLLAIAVIVVTLAFIYVGFMMIFRGADWNDVARIFVGAMLIAGASALATLLIP
ncbi:MAG: TrbC/VirB2 family protein [Candidatus Desulfofervidus auxilii]|nr:TrbC/VirB2 family protein [Candidatus Desulfofervidus auxilii]